MLQRTLAAVARAALRPVRGPARLVRAANQHLYLPVLNGALGDQLAARHDARAIMLSFRAEGRDVPVAELGLTGPARKTVVFVHGLMGDELVWQTAARASALRYGPRLAAEADAQVLYVRYNTGRHISENGRALAALLAELVATYPTAVGELVLVGHSMGGLVLRSAGHYGRGNYQLAMSNYQSPGDELTPPINPPGETPDNLIIDKCPGWLARVRAVFLLGVPHEGSYLEQRSAAVERWLRGLDVLPTRLASQVLAQRSNGIKDLGRALLVDEDWQLPDAGGEQRPRTAVPLLPGVAYHVLVGSWLGAGRAQALRDYLGDGLVSTASGPRLTPDAATLPPGTTLHTASFAARHHTGLLHDEAVYAYLLAGL